MIDPLQQLLSLSHDLGLEERNLAILGEGNASARLSEDTFLIKASGSSLRTLERPDITECRFAPLLKLLDGQLPTDQQIHQTLLASQVSTSARRPSTEAFFHAYLLTLPGIQWVAHTHPVAINGITCSRSLPDFAQKRMFPDQIVCCGAQSVIVPYTDPGLPLARAIETSVEQFISSTGHVPKTILLANHGIIAPSPTAAGAFAATIMAEKAAEIFNLAAQHGGAVFMSDNDGQRIDNREDEHFRQRRLGV